MAKYWDRWGWHYDWHGYHLEVGNAPFRPPLGKIQVVVKGQNAKRIFRWLNKHFVKKKPPEFESDLWK